jgi:hypothetical protein
VSSLKSQWAEILVAPRVEEVEGEPLVLEAHHRRGDRDAALALDRHPIRAHPPPLAARLHFARQLDRPAKQQQFLGQCRLAGVANANSLDAGRRLQLERLSGSLGRYDGLALILLGIAIVVVAATRFVRTGQLLDDEETHFVGGVCAVAFVGDGRRSINHLYSRFC